MSTKASVGGFPDRYRTTLRYSENLALTATSGVPVVYSYRGNNVFDPNSTGTGNQPAGFDSLAAHYRYYRVFGSRFTIIASNGSNSNVPGEMALVPLSTTPTSTVPDYAAQAYATVGVVSSPSTALTLSSTMTTSRIFGQPTVSVGAADEFASRVTTGPVKEWYWTIIWVAIDGSTTLISQNILTIEYDVEFFQRESDSLDYTARIKHLQELQDKTLHMKRGRPSNAFASSPVNTTLVSADKGDTKRNGPHDKPDKARWSDMDDDDETLFADFLRWKNTTPKPTPSRDIPLNSLPAKALQSKDERG